MTNENRDGLEKLLHEIEEYLWEYEFNNPSTPVKYADGTMGSATKIFTHLLLNKMWEYYEVKKLPQTQREKSVETVGKAIRQIVLDHAGVDLHKTYKAEDETN